jgi:hypothetical protein
MIYRSLLTLIILALALAGCGGPAQTENAPVDNAAYPGPRYVPAPTNTPWYPEPAQGQGTDNEDLIMTSGYEPRAGDETLTRDKVFLDLEGSQLQVEGSKPAQVHVTLKGDMSDPCHLLRVVVNGPNDQNRIDLEVYSLVEPNKACITVIESFQASIPLGSLKGGHYQVYVNNELLGEFDA